MQSIPDAIVEWYPGRPALLALALMGCATETVAPPGPATVLIIEQLPNLTGLVGDTLAGVVLVRAEDASGTPTPDAVVEFVLDVEGGALTTTSRPTDLLGRVGTRVRLAPRPGSQRLSVSTPGAPPVTVTFTATTGSAHTVAGNDNHLCALDATGGIHCWRSGFTSYVDSWSPHAWSVDPGRVFTELASAGGDFCAIDSSGAVGCWRAPAVGVEAVWTTGVMGAPPLRGLAGEVSYGPSWCGLTAEGQAWCWGSNQHGLIGDGSTHHTVDLPTPLATDARFVAVSLAFDHYCGLDADGVVWCWGSNDALQLGYPDRTERRMPPRPVAAPVPFTTMGAVGAFSATCGLGTDRRVYCWGSPQFGLLGRSPAGGFPDSTTWRPVAVPGLEDVVDYQANEGGSIALTGDGRLVYWGTWRHDGATPGAHRFTGLGIRPTRLLPGRPVEIACVDVLAGGTVCLNLNRLLFHQVSGAKLSHPFAEAVP